MRVTFLHPDLGIGGAERLVVDCAIALQQKGHEVRVVTNHYDDKHCFQETKDLDIRVVASWFPRSVFGRAKALCAYLRMCIAAIFVCLTTTTDIFFVDQVSACVPILRWFSTARVFFYCHFPDLLLTDRRSLAKKLYRYFVDAWEAHTTSRAHAIAVNSRFTAGIVRETWPSLGERELHVLHPSLNTVFFDSTKELRIEDIPGEYRYMFVSLNRFERKKNIRLAVQSFAELKRQLPADLFKESCLVLAGGFDPLCAENSEVWDELHGDVDDSGLDARQVIFARSPSDSQKLWLLRRATAVLYTPSHEHFGIVPVEAMYCECPVIAINNGGPTETIVTAKPADSTADEPTGFLLAPDPDQWGDAMATLVQDSALVRRLGASGKRRVEKLFAFAAFADRLDSLLTALQQSASA